MACSIPGFPVLHYFLEFSQAHILSQWCHPTISSSAAPFSCPQSFPASEPFPMSQLFASGGQSIEASASASVLPMSTQGWFPLELTGLVSILSKGLLRVFSSTTVQKNQFYIWISSNEMDGTGADYTEWSKPERKTPIQYTNTYIWNLEKWQWWPCMQDSKKDTDVYSGLLDSEGEGEGGMIWENGNSNLYTVM